MRMYERTDASEYRGVLIIAGCRLNARHWRTRCERGVASLGTFRSRRTRTLVATHAHPTRCQAHDAHAYALRVLWPPPQNNDARCAQNVESCFEYSSPLVNVHNNVRDATGAFRVLHTIANVCKMTASFQVVCSLLGTI